MFICYPMIYDMTMLALVSYRNILIEWKYPVYPDSILKTPKVEDKVHMIPEICHVHGIHSWRKCMSTAREVGFGVDAYIVVKTAFRKSQSTAIRRSSVVSVLDT
jgi:hypothetical protein